MRIFAIRNVSFISDIHSKLTTVAGTPLQCSFIAIDTASLAL